MSKIKLLAATAGLAISALSAPAFATATLLPAIAGACANTDISPTADDCTGWYDGNLLNNGNIGGGFTNADAQAEALALIGLTWNPADWVLVDVAGIKVNAVGDDFNFTPLLSGPTWIGIHKGKGGGDGFEGTGFFRYDNAGDLDYITLNLKGASSAVVDKTGRTPPAVPEPATWAMMIAGFGMVGGALRRKAKVTYSMA